MSAVTYSGNSHYYLLDQLRKRGHHTLADRVESGEISVHKAAKEAGMRPKQISMQFGNPERFVASLRRNGTPEFVAEVTQLLNESTS